MEVVSVHVDVISRAKGRSAVQMAAYCARDRYCNEYTGMVCDYTTRNDLVYHEVLLPEHAPEAFLDSETLWNAVERVERSRNSRLARTVILALPKEFDHDTQIRMVRAYARYYFVQRGMCADVSIHDKGDGNPHAHALLTTRSLDSNGQWMSKQHRNYLLDAQGKRIFDPVSGRYKLGRSIKTNDWDAPERVEEWREGWATVCNELFRRMGMQKRVTHLSYERQGISREPTIHLGAKAQSLENRGIPTDRGNKNRAIKNRNRQQERQRLRQRIDLARERKWGRDR